MRDTTGTKRVKTGCFTCRIRRVKCDEEHPHCRRCYSTGRKCDGYSTLPFSRSDLQAASRSVSPHPQSSAGEESGPLPRLITDPAFEDLLEKRYFQFFRQKSVASNNHLVDTRFWDRLVLQACHHEPAIKHAVLALSSLHQLGQLPRGSDVACRHEAYAERQHQKALAAAQQLISGSQDHDLDKILTACIVFILFESVRGHYKAAAMHMASGRAILAQNAAQLKRPGRRNDLLEIEHALARLDLAAVYFQDSSSPYTYGVEDFHSTNPAVAPYTFTDIQEAQTCLFDLCRWTLLIDDYPFEARRNGHFEYTAKHEAEKVRCQAQLRRWQEYFKEMLRKTEHAPELVIFNLKTWYTFAMLLLKAGKHGPEARFDAFISDFEVIVSLAEKMARGMQASSPTSMFSFELGYLGPAYFTATRCRDPHIRRRAVAILRDCPRQEGVLESVAAGSLAAVWVEAEEEGLHVRAADDVKEERRLESTDLMVDVGGGQAMLTLNFAVERVERKNVLVKFGSGDGVGR